MAGAKVPLLQIADPIINRMQQQIVEPLNRLLAVPFIDGILLKNTVLPAGATAVNHKLGREVQGYLILKQNAQASIYSPSGDKLQIILNSSAVVTVDLWVF